MIIEVPRPARLSGPDPRPPEQVTLPLAVHCWFGIAQYLLFPAAVVAIGIFAISEWTPGRVVLATLLVFGIVAMFVAWRDSRDPRPVLVITAEHVHDRRVTAHPIPWSEVRSVKAVHFKYDVSGLRLGLTRPVAARYNPLRPGTLFMFRQRKPDEIYIPLRLLSATTHVLMTVIATLVARHGGKVDPVIGLRDKP
jgi:hypothetical protein